MNFAKRLLMPVFRAVAKPGIGLPHMYDTTNTEQELMLAKAKPAMIGHPEHLNDNFKAAIERGDVVVSGSKNFTRDDNQQITVSVYALKDKAQDGEELFKLYYETDFQTEEDDKKATHRIGELLGYTEDDTKFFVGEGIYRNPYIREILLATASPRRWARKEVMLAHALDQKNISAQTTSPFPNMDNE